MKRSDALKEILEVLLPWESSKIEIRTAEAVMKVIEEKIKMQPPIWFQDCTDTDYMGRTVGHVIPRTQWEPEPKKKRKPRKAK
jgi:hypothetical protein